jgi:hypothetical protein
LVRTNYRGRRVPAVLGEALIGGALVALAALALFRAAGWEDAPTRRMSAAVGLLILILGAAGAWDDRRGDERPRGFKGHLGAVRTGRLTGGLVKLLAGGLAGLAAGWILSRDAMATIEVGLLVALAANLLNLLDRAPGRAGKVGALGGLLLLPFASQGWLAAVGGVFGALAALLPLDLRERGMLGDAGANPLGAVLGLGLATALSQPGRWLAIVLLIGLNAASERWSFSDVIGSNPVLKRADMLGRRE